MAKKNWIAGALGKPGALHTALHVPAGQKIPRSKLEEAIAAGGKVGKEAQLAETLEGFHDKGKSAKEVVKAVKHGRRAKAKSSPKAEGPGAEPAFGSAAWRAKYDK